MSDSKRKKIVTKCGSLVNMITVLDKIRHVATRLVSTVNHLEEFVTKIIDDNSIEKRIILKQVYLIERLSEYMKEKILFVTAQYGNITLNKYTGSRKRAATNLNLKININMKMRSETNYITLDNEILAQI